MVLMIGSKRFSPAFLAAALVAAGATGTWAQEAPAPPAFVPTTFDVLRLPSDGGTVIVGAAEPGALVELLQGTAVVGRAEANALGEWIIAADGLPAGTHRLTVRTTSADGRFQVISDEPVIVAVTPLQTLVPPEQPDDFPAFAIADFAIAITVSAGSGAVAEGAVAGPQTAVVQRGDTLWDIAERFYGNGALHPLILDANRDTIRSVRALQPGQTLIVPPAER